MGYGHLSPYQIIFLVYFILACFSKQTSNWLLDQEIGTLFSFSMLPLWLFWRKHFSLFLGCHFVGALWDLLRLFFYRQPHNNSTILELWITNLGIDFGSWIVISWKIGVVSTIWVSLHPKMNLILRIG